MNITDQNHNTNWLAYEWSNLLPTCTKCNRHKKDKFPLINKNNRVKQAPLLNKNLDIVKCKADNSILIDEKPFILHPKIDNPKEYFDFKISENFEWIEIYGKDKIDNSEYTGKGIATIKICDLNRIDLKKDRYKKVVEEIVEELNKTFKLLQICEVPLLKYEKAFMIYFEAIEQKSKLLDIEHTMLRTIIIDAEKFETIICPAIEKKNQREYIKMAYRKYKSGQL